MRPNLLLAAASLPLLLWLAGCGPAPAAVTARATEPAELTFLVAADTHFGAEGIEERNARQIEAMNAIPGTPWPAEIGGTVGTPAAVLIAGDLTDTGTLTEWAKFVEYYGLTGKDGKLRYPVFEGSGNHDRPNPLFRPVVVAVARRHGGSAYSFGLGGLHFICLDEYPDDRNLVFLREDLAKVGKDQPTVVYFHFSILGPYSDWWTNEEKQAFRDALTGYRIEAIFHGHFHGSDHYVWKGLDVYDVGSPRHRDWSFAVCRWGDGRLDVAEYDWRENAFR